jgi:2-oxoglutarate ferredoxin oxidoreductase subunit delta
MRLTIDTIYCKGCNLCIAVCTGKALTRGATRNARGYMAPLWEEQACVACMNCEITCPELAITVEKEKK